MTLVCVDLDIMKTPNMASNLDTSTNPGSVSNVIPKAGAPDYWTPPTTDAVPAVQVILPVVNGAVPGSYELTEINIIANNFNSFTVTVYDSGDNIAFTVSFSHTQCILIELMPHFKSLSFLQDLMYVYATFIVAISV